MRALQQKQQEQQKYRELLSESAKYKDTSDEFFIQERVQRCAHLQYEKHEQLFAVSYSTIHKAAAENSLAGVKYFLTIGLRRDQRKKFAKLGILEEIDKNGMGPLHYAAEKGAVDVITFLLQQNCDINLQSKEGNTALMYACKYNRLEAIKTLIEGGCDIKILNNSGMNAVHFAAQGDYVDSIITLVECLNVKVSKRPATEIEGQADDESTAKSIAEHFEGSIADDSLSFSSKADLSTLDIEVLKALNHPSNNKATPLHVACSADAENVVRLLLEYNVLLNYQDSTGDTPLHKAGRKGYYHIYQLLVSHGASDNIQNIFRETPADVLTDTTNY
jgi:ankyrin repeat protein